MTNFYEVKFKSSLSPGVKTQVYKAESIEDAKRQHARTSEIMAAGIESYEEQLITCSEVTSKSKIKRLQAQGA